METVQSRNGYDYEDDGDDEDNDLESAAGAQRLIQSGCPGYFQAVARKCFCCDLGAALWLCVLLASGAAARR